MTGQSSMWRQRLWVWLPALVFFLANAAAFSVYRLGYAGDVQSLEEEQESLTAQLEAQQAERRRLESLLGRAHANRQRVEQLYEERFSTRSRRLIGVTAEVKDLAGRAGLAPKDITYPEEYIEEYGLVKRSFIFSVEGTYTELRKFINLLELSDSFLILEEATLTEGGDAEDNELRINLKLSTLFSREPGAVPRTGRRVS